MKKIMFYGLATALVLSTGCTKQNEDGTTETMSAEEVADKTQEVAVQTAEKTAEVTKQATASVKAMSVKAEDVMDDLNKSVEQIKQQVAGFDKSQLLGYATKYKDVLLEKKDQIAALGDKVKGLSMTEMLGEKGKALKDQLSQYTSQLSGLKDRYGIYLEKLKSLGVDLSAYGL